MDNHRSPLQAVWHTMLLLLGIAVVALLIVKVIESIWVWLLIALVLTVTGVIAFQLLRARQDRW